MQQWTLEGTSGFYKSNLRECPMPKVSGNDVLVKFYAASLNYRDLMILKVEENPPFSYFSSDVRSRESTIGQQSRILFPG